jgi:hypothetical protein
VLGVVARRGRRETRSCLGCLRPPIPPGRGAPCEWGSGYSLGSYHQSPPVVKWPRSEDSLGARIAELSRPLAAAASLDRPLRGELLAASPGDGQGRREPDSARTGGSPAFRASPCAPSMWRIGPGVNGSSGSHRSSDRSRRVLPRAHRPTVAPSMRDIRDRRQSD